MVLYRYIFLAESGSQDFGLETQKEYSFHNFNGQVDSKAKAESKGKGENSS
jgi:hypothetical protein